HVKRFLWLAAGFLAALSITSALGRAIEVLDRNPGPSAADRLRADAFAAVMGAPPGSEGRAFAERQVAELTARFDANPRMALLHVVPALLLMTLPFLQFSSHIRL